MKKTMLIAAAAAFAASAALAQGPGYGGGPGGPGKGPGKGPDNKMLSIKTYDECVAYLEEHRKQMEARAKERGRPMPGVPAQNLCERMRQAGRFG